jgi:hypothetical protein
MKVSQAAATRPTAAKAARLMRVASPPTAIGDECEACGPTRQQKVRSPVVVELVRGALWGGVRWWENRRGGGNTIGY